MRLASETSLMSTKKHQRDRWEALKGRFPTTFDSLDPNDIEGYVSANWKVKNSYYFGALYYDIPFNFIKVVSSDMFPAAYERPFSRMAEAGNSIFQDKWEELTQEDLVGDPQILDEHSWLPSYKTLQSAFQLGHYFQTKNYNIPAEAETVIEYGGGYGSLAKMIWQARKKPDFTYIIIDTPLFCSLQWLYLSSILGEENVHIHTLRHGEIVKNKINILPIYYTETIPFVGDVFIGLYSISESTEASQDLVVNKNWFDCPRLLIAYQENSRRFPIGERTRDLIAESREGVHTEVASPFSWYAFV
jgi:hypothetical protein